MAVSLEVKSYLKILSKSQQSVTTFSSESASLIATMVHGLFLSEPMVLDYGVSMAAQQQIL